jgi:hypothetical protein
VTINTREKGVSMNTYYIAKEIKEIISTELQRGFCDEQTLIKKIEELDTVKRIQLLKVLEECAIYNNGVLIPSTKSAIGALKKSDEDYYALQVSQPDECIESTNPEELAEAEGLPLEQAISIFKEMYEDADRKEQETGWFLHPVYHSYKPQEPKYLYFDSEGMFMFEK